MNPDIRFLVDFTKLPRPIFTEDLQSRLTDLVVEATIPASPHIWRLGVRLDHPKTFDAFVKWHWEFQRQETNRYALDDSLPGEATLSLYDIADCPLVTVIDRLPWRQLPLLHQYKISGIRVQAIDDIQLINNYGLSDTMIRLQLWFSHCAPVPF